MNRIQLKAGGKPAIANAPPAFKLDHAVVRTEARGDHHLSIFAPLHYEANYAYPLLVWLHGPRDDERQLQRVMPLISMRNYVAIGPRAVSEKISEPGFSWPGDEDVTQLAQRHIFDAIETVKRRFHLSSQRIFLAGLQCGGTMALRIGLRNPKKFAGIASLGGPFPTGNMPLRDLRKLRSLPLFIAHNRDSQQYSVEHSSADLRLLHSAGMRIALRQYPCGDELTTKMLEDLNVWLMEQVTGQPSQLDSNTARFEEQN